MATRKKKNIPLRTLVAFFVIVMGLGGVLATAATVSDATWTPKLALDLEGGTQLILAPTKTSEEGGDITDEDMNQAIDVIRQRVDSSGVAEAEIARMGSDNITVGLPGQPSEETLELVSSSAVMRFRPVIQVSGGAPLPVPVPQEEPADKPAEGEAAATPEQPKFEQPKDMSAAEVYEEAKNYSNDVETKPELANSPQWVTPRDQFIFTHLNCTAQDARKGGSNLELDNPDKAMVACSKEGNEKYILGPMVLSGQDISSAASGLEPNGQGGTSGKWVVDLSLNSEGARKFDDIAAELYKNHVGPTEIAPPNNRFAIVLDSLVVSAPSINVPSYGGKAVISGSLTRESSATLANQIKFGSLPLNFEVLYSKQISPTLGVEYLRVGFYAAIVGLVLVIIYLLWQYHALSIIATSSLILAGVITYLVISILSWSMGYRLSTAGVVGLIVAVGTVTDSFIVYFERIRDEVRDGKPLVAAVEGGWKRAKRTIVVSDMVNLVAAGVLYLLAVGGVQGFAFTLGLTTAIDLLIIFLFTHPMMALFIKTRYFGQGRRFSGLDPVNLGAASDRAYLMSAGPADRKKQSTGKSSGGTSLARMKLEKAQAEKAQAEEGNVKTAENEGPATDDSSNQGEENQK